MSLMILKPSTNLDTRPKSERALELHSRAEPSVKAHHRSDGPDAGRNSRGSQIIIKKNVPSSQTDGHASILKVHSLWL